VRISKKGVQRIFLASLLPVQRKFLGNLFILQALNWLIKPVWIFWVDRLAQVQLGDAWYGKYYVVFSFGLLFNILLDFGLNNYVAAQVGKDGNPAVAKPAMLLRFWLAGLYIALVTALGIWLQFEWQILAFIIANQVLAGFVLFFRSILQGRHLFRTDSLVSVTDRLVAIVVCAAFLYGSGFEGLRGVLVFLGAQTLGYTLALVFACIAAYRGASAAPSAIPPKLALLLRQTAWFAVLAFAMSVFTRIDALMIRNLSAGGYAEAGLYAQSFRLLDAALIFSSLISTMLLPLFSRQLEQKENTHVLVWLNLRIVLFVAIPAALAAYFYGAEILDLLYAKSYATDAEFLRSQQVFFPIMCCFIPMAMVHIFGTWLTAANKLRFLSVLAILCMLINVLLNYWLIPENGAIGAAWACLITQGIFATVCMAFTARQNGFSPSAKELLLLLLWLAISFLVFFWFGAYFPNLGGLFAAGAVFILTTAVCGIFWAEMKKGLGR
jgi:O-antigen/teichoic acid export membrane protein